MDDIFSDDDEFEAFRDQLFEGKNDEQDEKLVPMFGLYAIHTTSNQQKPRQDMFLRGLEAPSNDLDPYKDVIFDHKQPDFKKKNNCGNFSFFGMKQDKFKMETSGFSIQDQIAERNKLLEKVRRMEKESQNDINEDGKYIKESPRPKPLQARKVNVDTPRPAMRKRSRRIVVSSDEDSDSEVEINRSPRKKRVSPEYN